MPPNRHMKPRTPTRSVSQAQIWLLAVICSFTRFERSDFVLCKLLGPACIWRQAAALRVVHAWCGIRADACVAPSSGLQSAPAKSAHADHSPRFLRCVASLSVGTGPLPQELVRQEVSEMLTMLDISHNVRSREAQGAVTIDIVLPNHQVSSRGLLAPVSRLS